MATVTINEATKLVRRSRRDIYRDFKAGRLSYKTDRDGHRRIDTSELERVYGPLIPPTVTPARATDTASDDALIAEIRALREELSKLRDEVRELRRLPSPETVSQPDHAMPVPPPADEPTSHDFSDIMAALRRK